MRVSARLLCLALLALLFISSVTAFNPYEEEDDVPKGETPKTSTLDCKKDPVTGEERCESITKIVPDDEELERKIEEVEREREELAAKRAEAKRIRDEKYQAEREAKKAAKDKKRKEKEAAADAEKKKKGPSQDDYKIKAPLKKLRVDYYKFFGVERDAPKLKVRKAANTMAAENHPDNCPTDACRDKIVVLNAARDVLLNDETRAEYDFLLQYGFKVYDKELYDDMMKQYKENPDEMPNGFDDDFFDPSSDYSSMQLTESSAGWLLLFTGAITLGMIAWPIVKFWEKEQNAEAKKAALKKGMAASIIKGKEALGSMKKKEEKYTGEKGAKRFEAASPAPISSPRNNVTKSASNKSATKTATIALVCMIGVMSFLTAPVVNAAFGSPKEVSMNYYELLEVASGVEAAALKKA